MNLKKTTLLILILSISCAKQTDNKNTSAVDLETRNTTADKLHGFWLSDSYLIDISNSQSIFKSKDYKTKLWGFTLDKNNLMTESANINGFTEHEGGYGCSITYDSVRNCFINARSAEYRSITEPFSMTLLDDKHLQFDFADRKEIYRKVQDEQTELRKILFQGQFRDLKSDRAVEFSADGSMTGFDNQKFFELVYDFGEGIFYDVSIFYPNQDSSRLWTNGEMFHYKIDSDTLKLYKITPDWEGFDHKIGELKYLLVKS